MNELKVGDVVSELHRNGFEYWAAKKVTQVNRWGDLRDDSFVAGGTTFYFKNKDWVKGLHKSLIPEGFAIVPVEPTQNMVKDAMKWFSAWSYMRPTDKKNAVEDAYKAMIEAAPKPTDR
jgi:hypothetical protein